MMTDDFLDFQELEEQLSQICDKSEIEECLKQQMLEIEMIQSMFSNPGEFIMDDPGQLYEVSDYLEGTTSKTPPRIDFSVNLLFGKMKVEVCVTLPQDYPVCEPDVFVRNGKLNRHQQHLLNEDLTLYIDSLTRGETCVCSIISWLQDNLDKYSSKEAPVFEEQVRKKIEGSFSRFWVYSHHIYSKTKRKDILSLADDFNVTGFLLSGKPGIICVEGETRDAEDWWARVRAMNWKKIALRKNETLPLAATGEGHNKFKTFQEVTFTSNPSRGIDHHMDMGEFYKFLEKHDCAYIFMDYFGVSGRTSAV